MPRRLDAPPSLLFNKPKTSNQKKVPYKEVEYVQSHPSGKYVPYYPTGQLYGTRGATEPPIAGFAHNVEAYRFFSKRSAKNNMPYRRRPSRNRRRRNRRRGVIRRSRAVSLWPRKKLVKMRMVYTMASTTGAGTIQVYTIKANSLNDPTGTLTAQLPLGLDQWAAMYQQAIVVGGKIWVRMHSGSGTGSMMYGITLLNTATTLANHTYYMETPLTRSKMLSTDVDHSSVGMSFSAKKFFKVRKLMDAEDQHATFSTSPGDPTDLAYYHIWVQDTTAGEAQTWEAVVTQDFYVLLFDSIIPTRSSL